MGALRLTGLAFRLFVIAKNGGLTAAALPHERYIGLNRKREDDDVLVGAVILCFLTRSGENAVIRFHRKRTESGASQ